MHATIGIEAYQLSYNKESPLTTTIRLAGGWDTLPHLFNLIQSLKRLTNIFFRLIDWKDVSVGIAFRKLFANMTSTSQVEREEDIEPFDTDPWAQQLDLQ